MMKNHFAYQFFSVLVLLSFVLSTSNLYIYQHFCGGELYATSIFHTTSCDCNDETIIQTKEWINIEDNGCCKEKLIYAHQNNPFLSYHIILNILWILLFVFSWKWICPLLHLLKKFFFSYWLYHKRRKNPVVSYLSHLIVSSVVLRN